MDSGLTNALAAYIGAWILVAVIILVGVGFLLGWLLS
jgi:hypothetical protein